MDKTLLKNIFIIAIIVLLIGGLVTCAVINREKISELFVEKNPDFYTQPSPNRTDVPEITEEHTAEPTAEQTEEPTEAPIMPTQMPDVEEAATPAPTQTPEPTPKLTLTHGEETDAPIIEIQENEPVAEETPETDNAKNAEATEAPKKKQFAPLVITITKQTGSAAVYAKERVAEAGKVVDVSRFIRRNTYTFTIKFKNPGRTQIAFIYDNGRFSLPTYFYIYDIVATEDGQVIGTLSGEYAFSTTENEYMEMKDKYVYVYSGTIASLLEQFGVKLVMPTATPTPKPQNTNIPTPTPRAETITKEAVEYINYIDNSPTNEWVMSDEYNKEIVEITRLIEPKFNKSILYQFQVKSLDNPGYTNACFVHYINVNGMMLVDEINVMKITITEYGRIEIENLVTIQRNEDETFGELGFMVEQILTQYKLQEQKPFIAQ